MSEPFRGNVGALLEREQTMIEAKRDLEAEVARLRAAIPPEEPAAKPMPRAPLVLIGLCLVVLALCAARSAFRPTRSLGPPVGPASAAAAKQL